MDAPFSNADETHIRNIAEVVGVKESPLKTFPHVNQFEIGANYRH